jgi:hypothetical protein
MESDDAKLVVKARPGFLYKLSFAGCPIIARDLLAEANIHALHVSEASIPEEWGSDPDVRGVRALDLGHYSGDMRHS